MDTITHVVLGACLGEVLASKKLGKRSLALGAVAQTIPDFDVVCSLWLEPSANVLAHRGLTHSFLFGLLLAPLLGWIFQRWWRWSDTATSFTFWLVFFSVQIFTHVVLDAFNAYGTGWFEPFSHYRVSFHTLFVADPFYSVPLAVAGLVLLVLNRDNKRRIYWALAGILISTLYLGYGIFNKLQVENDVEIALTQKHLSHSSHFTTPTPFNHWLWFVVASTDSGSFVGYRSVFDRRDIIDFQFFPRQDSLLMLVTDQIGMDRLKRFSQGHYTVQWSGDTLIFNDLRFGQMVGWQNPSAGFVFHYYLQPDLDNRLVLQRGRFAYWDMGTARSLARRIKGVD